MKFNFQTFKEFFQCGANIACELAKSNGVSTAQVDLWTAQLSAKVAK